MFTAFVSPRRTITALINTLLPGVPPVVTTPPPARVQRQCDPCQVRWSGDSACWVCGGQGREL